MWVISVVLESLLTVPLQAELAMNPRVVVPEIHTAVSNIDVTVSDIRSDVAKIREGIDGQVGPVSESSLSLGIGILTTM